MSAIARSPAVVREKALPSPLSGVTNEAWTRFVCALAVQPLSAVSASNGIGMFAHRPRRLVDLGIMANPRSFRAPSGRMICVADFVSPRTDISFLRDPDAQYEVLKISTVDFASRVDALKKPAAMSLSGALCILHCAGPSALSGKLFKDKEALYSKCREIF